MPSCKLKFSKFSAQRKLELIVGQEPSAVAVDGYALLSKFIAQSKKSNF